MTRALAVALVVLGSVALALGGFGYDRQTTILDMGGIRATATQHRTVPIMVLAGTIALLGGVVLLTLPRMRRRSAVI